MAKLTAFFEKGEVWQPTSTCPTSLLQGVEGSKKKDSLEGTSSHPDVFCKKLKNSEYTQGNTCAGVSFKYCCRSSACNFIKKETAVQMFS